MQQLAVMRQVGPLSEIDRALFVAFDHLFLDGRRVLARDQPLIQALQCQFAGAPAGTSAARTTAPVRCPALFTAALSVLFQ